MPVRILPQEDPAQRMRDKVDGSGPPGATICQRLTHHLLAQLLDGCFAGTVIDVQDIESGRLKRPLHGPHRSRRPAEPVQQDHDLARRETSRDLQRWREDHAERRALQGMGRRAEVWTN